MEPQLVQAVYSFKGRNNDELCFKKGDIITVAQREEGGWWEGTLGDTTGWFPSDYVKEYVAPPIQPVLAVQEVQAFRDQVVRELRESEKAHVAELQALSTNFLNPLESDGLLSRDEYRQLASVFPAVTAAHAQLLARLEESGERVGGIFLNAAPDLQAVHVRYCSSHPRAVCILDKYKDELNAFMENCGAVSPGILVLTTGLSKPFRRLDKYAAILQELGRHVCESHPDRGDTHRAVTVYKEMAEKCNAIRRQKELELQVVTGAVRGWQGSKDISMLGEVLHMGSVALGETHADRYFVLFPSTLLILSVSRRMSAFVYEGCLPLTGIKVTKLEDSEKRKNGFEISGTLIDTIIAVCQSSTDADKWVSLLSQYSRSNQSVPATCTSLPHSPTQMSPTEMPVKAGSQTSNHKRSHSFNNHYNYNSSQHHKDHPNDKKGHASTCDPLKKSPLHFSRGASANLSFADRSDRYSINSTFKGGWSPKNLRPAPPLRPMTVTNTDDINNSSFHPYAPLERKVNSYEEDGLILRVIEGYCTSARSRNTINSDWDVAPRSNELLVRSPSLPLHYASKGSPGLWLKVYNLETEVKTVKTELKHLKAALCEMRPTSDPFVRESKC